MACDEGLVQRIRELLQDERDVEEKRMFGGVAFLVNGNMSCGVHKEDLIVRLEPEGHAAAIMEPFARTFDITGRPMRGWVTVVRDGCEDDATLARWIERAMGFARSLPAKASAPGKRASSAPKKPPTKAKPRTKAKPQTKAKPRTKTTKAMS